MGFVPFYSIVINGREMADCETFAMAQRKAAQLRIYHGNYSVWIRPHFSLVLIP